MEQESIQIGFGNQVDAVAGPASAPAAIIYPAAEKPIKRPPRGSNSCLRCKGRKQRCDFEPGVTSGKCKNCAR